MSLSTLNMYDFSLKYTNFAGHPPSPPGGVYIPLLVYLSPFEPMDLKYISPMRGAFGGGPPGQLGYPGVNPRDKDTLVSGVFLATTPLVDLSCETRGGVVAKCLAISRILDLRLLRNKDGLLQGGCCKKYP